MKEMSRKAEFQKEKLRNHKTQEKHAQIQTLSENGVPPQIAQFSGHKKLKSIQKADEKQQMDMSQMLSNISNKSKDVIPFSPKHTATSSEVGPNNTMNS